MSKNETKSTAVAKINNQEILLIEQDGEKFVAVKPICEALGVSAQGQIERLKSDPILNSTVKMILTVGADEKQREMVTIPFKFVFGWLFRIDSRKVKEESRPLVIQYQLECYNALYDHFTVYSEFVDYKQKLIDAKLEELQEVKSKFNTTRATLKETEKSLDELRKLNIEDYKAAQAQTKIDFEETEKGGESC